MIFLIAVLAFALAGSWTVQQLPFTLVTGETVKKPLPATMPGGIAVFDYDGDGKLDLFFPNGGSLSGGKKAPNRLFRNLGNMKFEDVTDRAGLGGKDYDFGVAAGDYDNDGRLDLLVCGLHGIRLYRNQPDGSFADVTEQSKLNNLGRWSVGAAWFDMDNDGDLDLFVVNYVRWDPATERECLVDGKPDFCHPRYYDAQPNALFRNNGDGTFTDVSAETGIAKHYGKGMGAVIADYDGDGFMDIFVANDNHPNFLFHNIGGKKFEEVAFESGVAYSQSANAISSMGADFKDVDNDGRPDIWHTAVENESFPLYRNRGGGEFIEVTNPSQLFKTRAMSGWSNGIFDFDNDGWKDLFVARGNVLDNVALFSNRTYEEPNSVFRNLGNGKFQDVSAEAGPDFQKAAPHRGSAFGDIDNDGRVDALVSVLNGKLKYFHNTSRNNNHWIQLKLTGTKSNRMGLGAQIRITTEDGLKQFNEVTTAVGYGCSSDPRVHFGLGASKIVREIEIKWPSRIRQILKDVAADQILAIQEPTQ